MTFLIGLLGTRAGAIGATAIAALLAVAVGVQSLRLSWAEAESAKKDAAIAARDATIAEQNAAVERMKADALAQSQAAADRARVALKPRPKPNTATIGALNQWLSGNP